MIATKDLSSALLFKVKDVVEFSWWGIRVHITPRRILLYNSFETFETVTSSR